MQVGAPAVVSEEVVVGVDIEVDMCAQANAQTGKPSSVSAEGVVSGGMEVEGRVPLVRAGRWGNVLVRSDEVCYRPEPRSAAAPCTSELSNKERRAQENADCIGGLRSPWKAVRKFPQLARTAALVRGALEGEFAQDPRLVDVVDMLGKDVAEGSMERKWLDEKVAELGPKLVAALGGATKGKDSRRGRGTPTSWRRSSAGLATPRQTW